MEVHRAHTLGAVAYHHTAADSIATPTLTGKAERTGQAGVVPSLQCILAHQTVALACYM